MRPSPPRTTKKVVIRRKKVTEPVEEQQPSGGGSPAALQMPPVRAAADGPADKRVLRRREKGRLRGCDVLGDMGEFEAELTAVLPPPPKPSPPPNKDTYNLDSLPPDVREAVLIAPDGGTALLAVYEALKAEK